MRESYFNITDGPGGPQGASSGDMGPEQVRLKLRVQGHQPLQGDSRLLLFARVPEIQGVYDPQKGVLPIHHLVFGCHTPARYNQGGQE